LHHECQCEYRMYIYIATHSTTCLLSELPLTSSVKRIRSLKSWD
jgi:hypothetical protein